MKNPIIIDRASDISRFIDKGKPQVTPRRGIHFTETHAEATNGKIAIRVPHTHFQPEDHPVRLDPLPAARILPANAVTEAIKTAPRKSTIPVMNTMVIGAHPKNKEEVMLATHNLDSEKSFHAKPIEAQFPKIEQVIPPRNRENAFTVILAPQLLSILAEYASRLNCAFIEFTFDAKEPSAVVRFDIPLGDGRIVDGAVAAAIRAR